MKCPICGGKMGRVVLRMALVSAEGLSDEERELFTKTVEESVFVSWFCPRCRISVQITKFGG